MTIKISVIISAYNHEKFIAKAIESVLNQSFTDLELLITDDNSTDRTAEIINKYQDSRLIFYKNTQNFGMVINTNNSIKKARGEYIAILNSDDFWEPNKLQKGGMDYYGKVMKLLYMNDPIGFMSTIRRSISFFMGLRKPFFRTGGSANQRISVHKSCALAAQTFMLSLKAEGYDTCPMEGFDEKMVKKILQLPNSAEICMVMACGIGKAEGIYAPRTRVDNSEVIFKV